jgi:tRNA nucleotidyltransferase (CCA-adding enzyme)
LLHDVGKPRSRAFSDKTNDYTFYEHERIGAEMVEPLLARLRFSNEERQHIVALVRHHLICYDASWSDAAVRRWIKRVGPELLPDLYLLNEADVRGKGRDATAEIATLGVLRAHVERIMAAGAAFSIRDLAIDGRMLMQELGMKPGPDIGRILKALLDDVVEDPGRNTREALLERARALLAG